MNAPARPPRPRIWPLVVSTAATGIAILVPLHAIVRADLPPALNALDAVLAAVMVADIIVRWRDARSLRAYGPVWLAIDVLAAIPFHLLTGFPLAGLLRVGKLARAVQTMRALWSAHIDKWNVFRLAYSGYWIILVVHWLACGWLALRGAGTDPGSAQETYLRALYWCVTTLTSVGYGDITPRNELETAYAILVMAAGVGMFGYVIGNIAHIIANLHPSRVRYVETMEGINAFMDYRGLPPDLKHRIRDYYAYRWEKRLGFEESAILNDLSFALRGDVSLFLKKDVIEKVPFFRGAGTELIREIALAMRPRVYMPGDPVFRAGEKGEEMYFIGRGDVEVLGRDGVTVQALLHDGDFFGEGALVLGQPRSATVRAVGYCDLYALEKTDFDTIMQRYPGFAAHITAMIRERFGPQHQG